MKGDPDARYLRTSRIAHAYASIEAMISQVEFSNTLQVGGFDQEYDFTVRVPRAITWAGAIAEIEIVAGVDTTPQ